MDIHDLQAMIRRYDGNITNEGITIIVSAYDDTPEMEMICITPAGECSLEYSPSIWTENRIRETWQTTESYADLVQLALEWDYDDWRE